MKPAKRCPSCNAHALRPHAVGCRVAEADAKKQVSLDLGTVERCPHALPGDNGVCPSCKRLVGE